MLERERERVGKPLSRAQPHVEVATKDAIRHWAEGIGDRNPLWTDEDYAAGTPWGTLLAPPTMVLALDKNIIGAAARGFPGTHGWHLGNSFEFFDVIRRDTPFAGTSTMESLEAKQSRYAGGTAYDQTVRTDLTHRDTGELLCTARTYIRRFERRAGAKSGKYAGREQEHWTEEQLREIAAAYASEEIRGARPRYIEDVAVGDQIPTLLRGPLTLMDCMAFNIGWGGSFVFAHGYAWDFLQAHPGAFPPNESNVPDSPERTHLVSAFAQTVGAPAAFDYGPQRIAWFGTAATNWMGDAGALRKLGVRILRPNYHGDAVYVTGTVSAVRAGEADLEMVCTNQRDEVVGDATATIALPSRGAA
jgi:acyl dehydratase